jgi:DNA polymerase-3 subunit gamma/tau
LRERYISTAKNANTGYLLSALNILNDTEINYKSARNKRLHVELALIRLTYLMQAIEIIAEGESVIKKKVVDTAKPVAFRNIAGIRPAESEGKEKEARLTIESNPSRKAAIESEAVETKSAQAEVVTSESRSESVSVKSAQLDKIRKQIAERTASGETQKTIPLDPEKLKDAWKSYSDLLKENKNPAVQSFDLAVLNILNDYTFEVITNNNLEQKFIEQEKRLLSEHLQKIFANKLLTFSVRITDTPAEKIVIEKTLSKKDQFLMMAEQYPLIRELKEKLKLDLDY